MNRNMVEHFNIKASDPKNKPDEVLKLTGLKKGDVIADIGVGGGYFTFRFSEIVDDNGKVFAVDIKKEYLYGIDKKKEEKGVKNIFTINIAPGESGLQNGIVDIVFMRNVTHHIDDRINYFKKIKKSLKSNGSIIIIDYKRGKFFKFWRLIGHFIKKEEVLSELNEAGFYLDREYDILPEHYFFVFKMLNSSD